MIKIGDLVAVECQFGYFLGIVINEMEGGVWRWTVAQCKTGDYVPCNCEELTVLSTPRQADAWEKKMKLKKILDKNR
jgi:hypothetical protein|tara:strand:+ start:328 stop:558 length:231 start_codon:yes stop_codon:yes gene_type:complete